MKEKKKKPFSESRKYSKYKVDNWPEYNEFLRNRGRIDVMISNNLAKGWYEQSTNGQRKRGGQKRYSDKAITICLQIRYMFGLKLRQTQGFVNWLFEVTGLRLKCPDYTTLSKRGKELNFEYKIEDKEFDHLFKDGEIFTFGNLTVKVIHTPGHTPACVSYLIEDNIFVGDSIFMPHLGTARADFPGGNAELLYNSIQKILSLPDKTKIYVCHDYPEPREEKKFLSTVKEQKETNIMINQNISKSEYIEARIIKDKNLATPKLLLPSIQTNIRVGKLPTSEKNGVSYIKIPLNQI